MDAQTLVLGSTWRVGAEIGRGGFGRVVELVDGPALPAVAKFIPKEPGADRELLFVDLAGVRNVVPVIDAGEHGNDWVIVMPRADGSLRDRLDNSADGLEDLNEGLQVLVDIAEALTDLEGRVVHRDLKPENVLLLGGRWCLADFGISRYAEASTAPDTHKFAWTPAYAAPERWRSERATSAADVYAVGIIAHELIQGTRPFPGPAVEDYREQHLHEDPTTLAAAPAGLASLVDECLFKSPSARPGPANLLARLSSQHQIPTSGGLAALAAANQAEVRSRAASDARASQAASSEQRRADRLQAARVTFARISGQLHEAIVNVAPAARTTRRTSGWSLQLGEATLSMTGPTPRGSDWGEWQPPAFAVDAIATLSLSIPPTAHGYEGRSHSLWFGDIQDMDHFAWYETAFMVSGFIPKQTRQNPIALDPGEKAAKAVWNGLAEWQVAWPFTRLDPDDLNDFIERWSGWLAAAATGTLTHPSHMPEHPPSGSWRKS